MKFKQFRLWERGVSNERAIKIDKADKRGYYTLDVVLEHDCTKELIPYGEDAVENMYLEMFGAMFENRLVVEFLERGGSVLKCSDTTKQVLDAFARSNGRHQVLRRGELDLELEVYELWEKRYMWEDQVRDVEWVKELLDDNNDYDQKEGEGTESVIDTQEE